MSFLTKARIPLIIGLLLLISASLNAAEESASDSIRVGMGDIIIPLSNPLNDFDSNGLAWWSVTNLLMRGEAYVDDRFDLNNSIPGRSINVMLHCYIARSISYYSHEIAHDYLFNLNGSRHFRVDWKDWSHLVPAYIQSNWQTTFSTREMLDYLRKISRNEHEMYFPFIIDFEAGLYQQRFNAINVAHHFEINKIINEKNAVSYLINQFEDFFYILFLGDKEICKVKDQNVYVLYYVNDINGYINLMNNDINIFISIDDWLAASGFADFLSAHTLNSIHALANYLLYGDEDVEPIRFRLGEKTKISFPNYYLFPSVRGLFLQTETFVDFGAKGCFLSFGSGLDAFGAHRTGPVDRLRIGGQYQSFNLPLRWLRLNLSPYLYLDFTNRFEHRGESIGIEANLSKLGRFSLYGKIEYNRDDMIEQVIKYKDNGLYFISGLVISM